MLRLSFQNAGCGNSEKRWICFAGDKLVAKIYAEKLRGIRTPAMALTVPRLPFDPDRLVTKPKGPVVETDRFTGSNASHLDSERPARTISAHLHQRNAASNAIRIHHRLHMAKARCVRAKYW
jgi:hypothetical protein